MNYTENIVFVDSANKPNNFSNDNLLPDRIEFFTLKPIKHTFCNSSIHSKFWYSGLDIDGEIHYI